LSIRKSLRDESTSPMSSVKRRAASVKKKGVSQEVQTFDVDLQPKEN